MKHLTWVALATLLVGAGCATTSETSSSVSLEETSDIPAAEAEETIREQATINLNGQEVPVEVEIELDEDEESPSDRAVVISMTANGFEPGTVTVAAGTTVTFVNNDTVERWPASAFHPTHLELPAFDAKGGIAPGASYSFTFTEVGTWKFHDHLIPSMLGSVIVE